MRIKEVNIRNFFQHESLDVKIRPGATAVLAPNGFGKSNLIRSIYAALTGEILGGGDLESALRWGSASGMVKLSFEHNGQAGAVSRMLKGTPSPDGRATNVKCKHSLVVDGEEDLVKKGEINDYLSQAIGVEVKALRELAFPRQGQLDRLFTCEHSDRAALLAEMLGLKAADKIRAALSEVKSRMYSIPVDEMALQTLRDRIAKTSGERDELQRHVDEVREGYAALEGNIPLFRTILQMGTTEERDASVKACRESIAKLETDMRTLSGRMRGLGPRPAEVTREDHAYYFKCVAARQSAEVLTRMAEDIPALVLSKPARVAHTAVSLEAMRQDVSDRDRRLRDYKRELALIKQGKCPTCGHEFKDAADRCARMEQYAAEAAELLMIAESDYRKAQAEFDAYAKLKQGWLRRVETFRNEWVANRKVVSEGDPEFDFDGFSKRLDELAAWDAESKKQESGRVAMARYEERGKALSAELERLAALEAVPSADREAAREVVESFDRMSAKKLKMEGMLASFDTELRVLREDLARREAELARARRLRSGAALMERAVTAFRPDGLPRMVIASQVGRLNKGIADAMEGFGAPFALSLSQDLDFVAEFESGKASASVLSGGQMTMAAIAFRFAMLDMRASGCGVMSLDEPTAFVDGANKQALIELLTRMDGFLASAGMAALVPTHDEELAGACSRIIKLDE